MTSDRELADLDPEALAEQTEEAISSASEPFQLFDEWFQEANASEPSDPNAMALATVDPDGLPNVRMVLLKGVDDPGRIDRGFVFYTNLESAKGRELAAVAKAAVVFHWKSLGRQVRLRGPVSPVTDEEADAYFATRPRGSRIGAWASAQSRPMGGRLDLVKSAASYSARYAVGAIPRPQHWSGFRIVPVEMEFWRERPFRLHDRLVFRRSDPHAPWQNTRLFP